MFSRRWVIAAALAAPAAPAALAALAYVPAYVSASELADGATISAGARLAATCAACHGTNGASRGLNPGSASGSGSGSGSDSRSGQGALPPLAGQSREALSASLRAFRAGSRPATIMTQIAKGYAEEQIELLAGYFAAQKK